jgi:hypothetical protein
LTTYVALFVISGRLESFTSEVIFSSYVIQSGKGRCLSFLLLMLHHNKPESLLIKGESKDTFLIVEKSAAYLRVEQLKGASLLKVFSGLPRNH